MIFCRLLFSTFFFLTFSNNAIRVSRSLDSDQAIHEALEGF